MMLEKVLKLKEKYTQAATPEEKNAIDVEMQKLRDENPDAWAMAMVESARETADRAEAIVSQMKVREQIENALPYLPLSYIAKQYFNKSRHWLYQKMNGNIVNGKPAKFTPEEIETLNFALQDLSKKIGSIKVA